MMVMLGAHLLHFASRLQKTVALSSGEAELNAHVMGATEGLGVASLCGKWHLCSDLACFCDSSAARGIASRAGVGQNETPCSSPAVDSGESPRGQGRSLVDFPRSEFGRCFDSPVHGSADERAPFPSRSGGAV